MSWQYLGWYALAVVSAPTLWLGLMLGVLVGVGLARLLGVPRRP